MLSTVPLTALTDMVFTPSCRRRIRCDETLALLAQCDGTSRVADAATRAC